MVANGALHCGSGCMLGDYLCGVAGVPGAVGLCVLSAGTGCSGSEMFAAWVVDFLFAYAFGVVFQYFAIKPMRDL